MVFVKHNSLKSHIYFNPVFQVFQGPGPGSRVQVQVLEVTHPALRRRGDVAVTSLSTSQRRRRYVSNETLNDVSMELRQDVSVVCLHDVLFGTS